MGDVQRGEITDRLLDGEFGRAGINADMKLEETGQKSIQYWASTDPDPDPDPEDLSPNEAVVPQTRIQTRLMSVELCCEQLSQSSEEEEDQAPEQLRSSRWICRAGNRSVCDDLMR